MKKGMPVVSKSRLILGIESSCDETAAAILRFSPGSSRPEVLSNVVASQIALHALYGGVVPELASREHLRNIVPVVHQAIAEARNYLCRSRCSCGNRRAGAGRSPAGRHPLRQSPRLRPRQAAHRHQPPRRPHPRRLAGVHKPWCPIHRRTTVRNPRSSSDGWVHRDCASARPGSLRRAYPPLSGHRGPGVVLQEHRQDGRRRRRGSLRQSRQTSRAGLPRGAVD